ncbi:selenocysteine insertion sequence-binding protein 2 [Pelomyxa schiedti]|nr:selenocysteine insertion sequence-binding protein 2 [Pelomyxa schiedti]
MASTSNNTTQPPLKLIITRRQPQQQTPPQHPASAPQPQPQRHQAPPSSKASLQPSAPPPQTSPSTSPSSPGAPPPQAKKGGGRGRPSNAKPKQQQQHQPQVQAAAPKLGSVLSKPVSVTILGARRSTDPPRSPLPSSSSSSSAASASASTSTSTPTSPPPPPPSSSYEGTNYSTRNAERSNTTHHSRVDTLGRGRGFPDSQMAQPRLNPYSQNPSRIGGVYTTSSMRQRDPQFSGTVWASSHPFSGQPNTQTSPIPLAPSNLQTAPVTQQLGHPTSQFSASSSPTQLSAWGTTAAVLRNEKPNGLKTSPNSSMASPQQISTAMIGSKALQLTKITAKPVLDKKKRRQKKIKTTGPPLQPVSRKPKPTQTTIAAILENNLSKMRKEVIEKAAAKKIKPKKITKKVHKRKPPPKTNPKEISGLKKRVLVERLNKYKQTLKETDQISAAHSIVTTAVKAAQQSIARVCLWQGCNLVFPRKIFMLRHIKKTHVYLDKIKSPFACKWDGCTRDRPFGKKKFLMKHMQRHVVPAKPPPSQIWTPEYMRQLLKAPRAPVTTDLVNSQCLHDLTPALDNAVSKFLTTLVHSQERLVTTQSKMKVQMKKRYVVGMHEVGRSVERGLSKCVIVAPNMEQATALHQFVSKIIADARSHKVPVVFALSRRKIGKVLHKGSAVTMVSVLNVAGSENPFRRVVTLCSIPKKLSTPIPVTATAPKGNVNTPPSSQSTTPAATPTAPSPSPLSATTTSPTSSPEPTISAPTCSLQITTTLTLPPIPSPFKEHNPEEPQPNTTPPPPSEDNAPDTEGIELNPQTNPVEQHPVTDTKEQSEPCDPPKTD